VSGMSGALVSPTLFPFEFRASPTVLPEWRSAVGTLPRGVGLFAVLGHIQALLLLVLVYP
jgi:hypothetical protein